MASRIMIQLPRKTWQLLLTGKIIEQFFLSQFSFFRVLCENSLSSWHMAFHCGFCGGVKGFISQWPRDSIRFSGERHAYSAYFYTKGIQYKIAFFAVKDLHPVAGGVDEYKHVSIVKVHPHPVRDYAPKAVEYQTHIRRMVVEPVRWLQSRLSIASRH